MYICFLIEFKYEFQTSEALTEKALSPNVLYLAVFVTMRLELFDLSALDRIYLEISMYEGERLFNTYKQLKLFYNQFWP